MPYLPTAQAWLTQSALLLEARPTTTRITTKYTLSKPSLKARVSKTAKSDPTAPPVLQASDPSAAQEITAAPAAAQTSAPAPAATRATLTLKTYNPASGVTLKYKTDKAAEVGRLILSLARLGRSMAGLPEVKEDAAMLDAHGVEGVPLGAAEVMSGVATPVGEKGNPVGAGPQQQQQQQQQVGGGQGGKRGKKKGKK